jgi:apolipoprotein N-acyltransferase
MRTGVAVLLSGAMWFDSAGVNHVWPLAWIAPLKLLILIPDLRAGRAAIAAFGASAIGALNLVLAYRAMPPAVLLLGVLFIALPIVLVALAWRAVERRGHPVVAIFAFPALLASEEYLISLVSPLGTFGSLAYSQADVRAVIQLASLTGLWGITFIVSLFPAGAGRRLALPPPAEGRARRGRAAARPCLGFRQRRMAAQPHGGPARSGRWLCDRAQRKQRTSDRERRARPDSGGARVP